MEVYRQELMSVKKELNDLGTQIQDLLDRQSELLDRQTEIEAVLQQQSTSTTADTDWNKTNFEWSPALQEKMKSLFHIKTLRPMQLRTMNAMMSGQDCLLIMPTGGGKSLCFQLPALISKGVTLVVSPLVSLMEDQVMALKDLDIEAAMLNASTDKTHLKKIQDDMLDKSANLRLLYVTPEKLAKSKRFMAKLEKMYQMLRFDRLVIDEVHCCSQWGHDFRPDYKFLGIMKRQFPGVPILGLTATATNSVLKDVKTLLNIETCLVFRASFNRANLYYEVKEKPISHKDMIEEMKKVISKRFPEQSGIIYTFSRKESEDVCRDLCLSGIKAGCYHGDLSSQERSRVHKAWIKNTIKVVVATIAFGMGIDKPDVRFVIHHSLSKSMENLYQESGRAGRDDQLSHCIVYYRFQDVFRQSSMVFTEKTGLEKLYGIMEYCTDVDRCRRAMIARHFGEIWDQSQCNKMCDHCSAGAAGLVDKKDITLLCQNVLKILSNAGQTEQRLTAIKLMDSWQGRGTKTAQVAGASTALDRPVLERILAILLLHGYIKEDFHFTPYSTISYLVPGHKASLLTSGTGKMYMQTEKKKDISTVQANTDKGHKCGVHISKVSKDNGIRSTNITAEEKKCRKITKSLSVSNTTGKTKSNNELAIKKCNSDTVSIGKRRKAVIIDSDSDELDFGDAAPSLPRKVRKSGKEGGAGDLVPSVSGVGQRENKITASQTLYVLDSDSD